MILRRLLTITILLTSTIWSQAQQINAVPDYVFRNQMSVGRNAVTDTAAYFSIGPRYGANKGFMPPIVVDTATFSSGKRNGLLIFSVQKNKFLYWDSVRVQWSDMAGSSGAYIVAGDTASMLAPYLRKVDTTAMLSPYYRSATASAALALKLNISDTSSMLTPYIRHAGYGLTKSGQSFLVDTLNIATRAWRQKGLDSLAALEVSGSGTTNYVPKFTAGSTIGNSQIFDNGTNVGIGTASPGAKFHLLSATGTAQTQGDYANNLAIMQGASRTGTTSVGGSFATTLSLQSNDDVITAGSGASIGFAAKWNTGLYSSAAQFGSIFGGKENSTDANLAGYLSFATRPAGGNPTERLRISSSGVITVANLAGSGARIVVADASGNLSATTLSSGVITGSGTAGYITRWTGETTQGNSQIFDNGTRVGIGTVSPAARLDIRGTGAQDLYLISTTGSNQENTIQSYFNNGGGWSDFSTKSQNLLFYTGPSGGPTTERLRITSGGNIGIGIADPESYLTGGRQLVVANTPGAAGMTIRTSNTGDGSIFFSDGTTGDETYRGYVQYIHASDALRFGTSATERIRIFANGRVFVGASPTDAGYQLDINGTLRSVNGANFATTSGNVGIGTASPAAKTDISGTLRIGAASFVAPTSGAGMEFSYRTSDSTGYLTTYSRDYSGYRNQAFYALSQKFAYGTGGAIGLFLTSSGETLINTESDAGDYKLQVSGRGYFQGAQQDAAQTIIRMAANNASAQIKALDFQINAGSSLFVFNTAYAGSAMGIDFADAGTSRMRVTADGEVFVNTTSDAGDYKLQVVGNARIGTGKLDIASNTTFGLGVARSGTSEVAGQIYNSNGILYLGAESSAGGQIFSGSSAYAAVIGSGANYPLQFATNNITRATMTTSGNLLLGFTTDSYFLKLQVNGSIFSNNQIIAQGVNAQIAADSSANISPLYISNQSLTGSSAQGLFYGSTTWNTTGNPSLIDLAITNTASGSDANYIKISDGSNIFRVTKAAEVVTAAPTGGSIRKWKLGEAATVSPTSPNRTIRVEIDGTVYYLHAKTTND